MGDIWSSTLGFSSVCLLWGILSAKELTEDGIRCTNTETVHIYNAVCPKTSEYMY